VFFLSFSGIRGRISLLKEVGIKSLAVFALRQVVSNLLKITADSYVSGVSSRQGIIFRGFFLIGTGIPILRIAAVVLKVWVEDIFEDPSVPSFFGDPSVPSFFTSLEVEMDRCRTVKSY
jgi:hypothetical protein